MFYTEYSNFQSYEGQPDINWISDHVAGFAFLIIFPDNVLMVNKRWSNQGRESNAEVNKGDG